MSELDSESREQPRYAPRIHGNVVAIAIIVAATIVTLTCIVSATAITIAFLVNAPW
jgi:hypothetical protein